MKTITEEEFDAQFTVVANHIDTSSSCDGYMFKTSGKELRYIQIVAISHPNNLWTYVDADDGIYIVSGYRTINRIGYFITTTPWTEDTQFKVSD